MGIIKAFKGALSGVLADQWKDIFVASSMDEHSAIVSGIKKGKDLNRGTNTKGSSGVITNGSMIYVPENTACIIFNQGGIEEIITEPGGYEYTNGQASIFIKNKGETPIKGQIAKRLEFGGISPDHKEIAYVNLREIRNLPFGTRNEQSYYDVFYECELEVVAFGMYSLQIVDAKKFVQNFVPADLRNYSFNDDKAKQMLYSDLMQSFNKTLNKLSSKIKVIDLPSNSDYLTSTIFIDDKNIGTWEERYGIKLKSVTISNISYSKESAAEVKKLNRTKMKYKTFESISNEAIDKKLTIELGESVAENKHGGFGSAILGALLTRKNLKNIKGKNVSYKNEVKALKHYKSLLDQGIITQEEFDAKKKEILDLGRKN